MGVLSNIFKPKDKPENKTAGSAYTFYMGGTTSGKALMVAAETVGLQLFHGSAGRMLRNTHYVLKGHRKKYGVFFAENLIYRE